MPKRELARITIPHRPVRARPSTANPLLLTGDDLILNGWKEIANYLGRGVRTVQRWEHVGLPIRRPNARIRSAVIATSEEVDLWLHQCGNGRPAEAELESEAPLAGEPAMDIAAKIRILHANVTEARTNAEELFLQMEQIQARMKSRAAERSGT